MKKINRITFLVVTLISVGLMAWAVFYGAKAPESGDIADVIALADKYSEDGDQIVKDAYGRNLEVQSVDEGYESIALATINKTRKSPNLNYSNYLDGIKKYDSSLTSAYLEAKDNIQKLADKKKLSKDEATILSDSRRNVVIYKQNLEAKAQRDSAWVARVEGISARQFAAEVALVVEYAYEQILDCKARLEAYGAEMQSKQARFESAIASLAEICQKNDFAIQYVLEDSENPNSKEVADYIKTIDELRKKLAGDKTGKEAEARTAKVDKALAATVALCDAEVEVVKAKIAEYDEKIAVEEDAETKKYFADKKKELEASLKVKPTIKSSIEEYAALNKNIKTEMSNIHKHTVNIEDIKDQATKAKNDAYNLVALAHVVYYIILWIMFLLIFLVAFMLFGFVLNLIQNPGGWVKKGAIVVVVLCVIGVAYLMANGNGWTDGKMLYVLDANEVPTEIPFGIGNLDSPDRYTFTASDYMLADISIWITYLAITIAAGAAVFSWIRGTYKS